MAALAWGARVPEWFRDRVRKIAADGGFDPSWLMACIKFESNFDPTARNPQSSASGLIQFMEATAEGLGTTIEAIRAMSSMEQLEYVDKYFRPYFGRIHTLSDCYAAILYPMAIGLPEETVIFPAGSRAFLVNKGLDLNHDQSVTKEEAASLVATALYHGYQYGNVYELGDTQPAAPIDERSIEIPATVQPEKPMGALLMPLLMSVVGKFINPTVAQNVTSLVTKDGQQSTAVQSLLTTILGAVAGAAGTTPDAMKADDKVAIAAVADVQADAVKLRSVESAAAAHLDAVGPFIDKLAAMDSAIWEAQNRGRSTVSTIAIEEHKAGLWDMTQTLVYFGAGMFMLLIVALLGALVFQSVTAKTIDPGLLGLAGPILMAGVTAWTAMIAYRFDGTKESHATMEAQRATERYREETAKS